MKSLRLAPFLSFMTLLSATASQAQSAPLPDWALGPFVRPAGANPVIAPNPASTFTNPINGQTVQWEALHTFNPAAMVRGGKIVVLYRAEDNSGDMAIGGHTSRLGLAESTDGLHFTRLPAPVFGPADDDQKDREWPGGCEDPRLTEAEDGTYVLTYTQWNRNIFRVGLATSKDLVHWTKHGAIFDKAGEKYANFHYKSAGILSHVKNGRLKAVKVNGKYWMYWGEVKIHLATSTNLIDWTPVEDKDGKAIELLASRKGLFDSAFPEVGCPPLLTDKGIVLIYNGKNGGKASGDPTLGADAYSAGQALFDAKDPSKLLARLDQPFYKPELPFEMRGQYQGGTTFVEGLVYFKKQWFIYYGCADSLVGVAVYDKKGGVKAEPIPHKE